MKTYVVNMLKDTVKRAQILAQLAVHPELDYQIWQAVEGRKLTVDEQSEMVLPIFYSRYGKNATLPAVGCSLSHIGIYRNMIETETKFALILEDDALISKDLKLEAIKKLLDTDEPAAILLTPDFWYRNENKINEIGSSHKVYKLTNGYMTSGYAINIAAAKLLIPKIYPVGYMADAWSDFVNMGLNLYGIVPHVISYPDGCGEIGLSQRVYKTPLQKFRGLLVSVYIRLLNIKSKMQGNYKSKKLWK